MSGEATTQTASAPTTQTASAPATAPASASATLSAPEKSVLTGTEAQTTTTQTSEPSGATHTDWTSGLNDDLKGLVQNKGFKDPAMVLESYRNLEKLLGAPKDKLLKLPENVNDPALMADVYAKLGRPETPDGYKLKVAKELEKSPDVEFTKQLFHEAGLTTKQADIIFDKISEKNAKRLQESTEQIQQQNIEQEAALKRKWGQAYDQKVKNAKMTMNEFGINIDMVDKLEGALGFSGVMELLDSIGSKLGEASFVSQGTSPYGVLTPDAARNRITELRKDSEFTRRYLAQDSSARQEMERLHRMAYPD